MSGSFGESLVDNGAADQVDLVQPTCVQPSQQYRSGAIKRSDVSQEFNASHIASSSTTCQNCPILP